MHRLHLNEHGISKLALDFVKTKRSLHNSRSAKQKIKEVHSKISSFWRSSDNPRSNIPKTIYALLHNLNEETMKCQKDIAFSTSENSMIMSNLSANEATNVESDSKNDSGIQDKSRKCEIFPVFIIK